MIINTHNEIEKVYKQLLSFNNKQIQHFLGSLKKANQEEVYSFKLKYSESLHEHSIDFIINNEALYFSIAYNKSFDEFYIKEKHYAVSSFDIKRLNELIRKIIISDILN